MKWLFAALLTLAFVMSASAQERKVRAAPTGTTRVAVINLGAVFTKYEKTAEYKDEVARTLKGMQEEAKKLTLDITGWQTQLQKNEHQGEAKAQLEEKLLNAKRRYEDLDRLAKSRVSKTQEQILGKMWGDIHAAVKTYAAKHKIELVIAYGDPVNKEDSISFPEIDRKMRTADQGGSMPFFVGPGVDISDAVTEMLNQNYRAEKANAPAGKSVDL